MVRVAYTWMSNLACRVWCGISQILKINVYFELLWCNFELSVWARLREVVPSGHSDRSMAKIGCFDFEPLLSEDIDLVVIFSDSYGPGVITVLYLIVCCIKIYFYLSFWQIGPNDSVQGRLVKRSLFSFLWTKGPYILILFTVVFDPLRLRSIEWVHVMCTC